MLGEQIIRRAARQTRALRQLQSHPDRPLTITISATTPIRSCFSQCKHYSTDRDPGSTLMGEDNLLLSEDMLADLDLLDAATQATQAIESAVHKPPTRQTGPAGDFLEAKRLHKKTFPMGTRVQQHNPDDIFTRPLSVSDISLETLLAHQTHLGHSTTRWNPANSPFIFGVRNNTHIISLDVTAAHLNRAAKVLSLVTENAGLILFVGTRPGHERIVVPAATNAGGCYLSRKYMPGMLSNRFEIISHCPLKVVNMFDEEIPELTEGLAGYPPVLPDFIVCLNPGENATLLREAAQLNIPTIGIIDTDTEPGCVTYPIPANDDSPLSVQLITGALSRAAQAGRERRLETASQGQIPYKSAYRPAANEGTIVTKKQASRSKAARSVVLEILARHERAKAEAEKKESVLE